MPHPLQIDDEHNNAIRAEVGERLRIILWLEGRQKVPRPVRQSLDRLADGISGFAKGNQHSFGEVDTFFVTFRDLVPRRTMPRTRMINESGFDGTCYDDKAVFWHLGSPPALRLSISHGAGTARCFRLRHLGLAASHRLPNLETLKLRVIQIKRLVVTRPTMNCPERL